jgi:anti-anti-sigma factor
LSNVHSPGPWGCTAARERDGAIRVAVAGEVDLAVAGALREVLKRALAEGASVIVDLRELVFMDSSGIHALADADQRAREFGKRLVIAHPAPSVLRILELTGLNRVLEIIDGAGPAID